MSRQGHHGHRRPATTATGAELLKVVDLKTHFRTERGTVRAVDGVSLTLDRGRTLGVVGESGSGKTVLSPLDHGPAPDPQRGPRGPRPLRGHRASSAYSQDDMRNVWGSEMAMVFQDPMTSLNPVMKIGRQITESLRPPPRHGRRTRPPRPRSALLQSVGIPEPSAAPRASTPTSCRAACASASTIAIALACGPKLLFADEPTTALDVTVQAQILNLLAAAAARAAHGHDPRHPRPRRGGRPDRRDRGDVRRPDRRAGARPACCSPTMKMPYTEALLSSIPKLEQPEPHPPRDHRRPAARPHQPAAGLPLRPPLPVRRRTSAARRRRRWSRPRRPATSTAAGSRSARPRAATRWPATWPPSTPAASADRHRSADQATVDRRSPLPTAEEA